MLKRVPGMGSLSTIFTVLLVGFFILPCTQAYAWNLSDCLNLLKAKPAFPTAISTEFVMPQDPNTRSVYLGVPGTPRNALGSTERLGLLRMIAKTYPAQFGGELRLVVQLPVKFNPSLHEWERGYMQANEELMGKDGAAFLGHRQIAVDEFLDPDAYALSQALKFLNDHASSDLERAFIDFYEPVGEDRVSDESFTEEFAFWGGSPKSRNTSERAHDGNFHEGGIFLLPDYIRLARAQARVQLRFIRFLRMNNFRTEDPHIDNRLKDMPYIMGNRIDNLTAAPATRLNENFRQHFSLRENSLGLMIFNALNFGRSPRQLIEQFYYNPKTLPPRLQRALQFFMEHHEKNEPDFDYYLFNNVEQIADSEEKQKAKQAWIATIEQDVIEKHKAMTKKMGELQRARPN